MSNDLQQIVEAQSDIVKCKFLSSNKHASTFKVTQWHNGEKRKQVVRVIHSISNHYQVKREKDLLHYLNQFSEFIHFNEIRKAGVYYLKFFDYAGKYTLDKQIKKEGIYSQDQARQLMVDMIAVLERVHFVGFVHGNIRPENVVVGKKQHYLTDWSQSFPSLSSYETEMIHDDAHYFPPERLNGQNDEKGDIYALGCTLYFALTGKHIYRLKKSSSLPEQMWAHVHHSVHKMNKLPIFWRYLIFWMTQKDPEKRPQLDDLKNWVEDATVPDWVRKLSARAEKSYPEDSLTTLADEHYLYPIYLKAKQHEANGDLESAFNLYENCAFRGFSLAETKLGDMYVRGEPVKQSYIMAANMYNQAFQKGNPDSTFNLAKMFEQGLGMPVNLDYAFKLYRHAAMRGHVKAQFALAMFFLKGKGTGKNMAQARSWLNLAAIQGSEEAKQTIKSLVMEARKAG